MKHPKDNQRGFTLVELIVAMAIFLVVVTLAVGAFVTVSRMKSLTSTAKEVQQKTRIATEMITRLSRQADKVITAPANSNYVELYFNLKSTNPLYANKFAVENGDLNVYECVTFTNNSCTDWGTPSNILGDSVELDADSYFKKTGTIPPRLEVRLTGKIGEITDSPYYSNQFTIDTDVILEGIK